MESDRELRGWHLPSREAALHAFDKSKDTLCSGGNSIHPWDSRRPPSAETLPTVPDNKNKTTENIKNTTTEI